jgi:Protein of unknown function (DUF2971)
VYRPPSVLYKYFGPERLDAVTESKLRFSPLSAFNDPFEGRPDITDLAPEGTLEKAVWDGLPAMLEEEYHKAPEQIRMLVSADQFVAMCMSDPTGIVSNILNQTKPLTTRLAKSLPDMLNEHVGTLCLTEIPDSLLMWAHYGASHTGFVVGFDTSNSFFHSPRSEKDEFYHLRRVSYRATRPGGALLDLDSPEMFLCKSEHWSYENEWRILKPLKDASSVISLPSGDIHLFVYPREAIKSITFGMRSAEPLRAELRRQLKSRQEYQAVDLYEAYADQTNYCVRRSRVAL